nr:DUF4129 domain-containing protein [Halomarina oriensis]
MALAAGAATLDSATTGPVSSGGDESGLGSGDSGAVDFGAPPTEEAEEQPQLIPTWLAQLLIAAVFLVGFAALIHYVLEEGLDAIKGIALTVVALTAVILFVYYLLRSLAGAQSSGQRGILGRERPQFPGGGGGGGGGAAEVTQVATDPSAVVLAVLAVVLVGAVAVVVRSAADSTDEAEVDPVVDDPDPTVREVGEAAGRAADRIDASGDVDNAIYRAWREMTDPLDVPRETSTPGEFATAAVDAGMSREDVRELTDLFETTRYGGVAIDDEREERAVTALRRIERTYGGDR